MVITSTTSYSKSNYNINFNSKKNSNSNSKFNSTSNSNSIYYYNSNLLYFIKCVFLKCGRLTGAKRRGMNSMQSIENFQLLFSFLKRIC